MKDLNLIVKADVQGSVEAVKASLEKLSNDEVRVRVIHGGVGAINESDVMLAYYLAAPSSWALTSAPTTPPRDSAARANVDMRMYRVIYDAINEIEAAMKGMLAPKFREVAAGPCRGAPDLQGLRRWHRGRLLRAGRQDPAQATARSGWCGTASSSTRVFWPPCSASRISAKEVLAEATSAA